MYHLVFNGKLEIKYPNEFIEDFNKLKEKHGAYFDGRIDVFNIGEFIDYQDVNDKSEGNNDSDIREEDISNSGQ